ncbi:hypothetical protein JCM3774_000647 [Rhodotorula dairenensis]
MVTKGVASVPSPVKNLREFATGDRGGGGRERVNHERFVEVVADEFATTYGLGRDIQRVDGSEVDRNDYVRDVVDELKSWDWQYGQTPEFTHDMTRSLSFGTVSIRIQSRHGMITSAEPTRREGSLSRGGDADVARVVSDVCALLVGDRYESLERTREAIDADGSGSERRERMREIVEWLQREM